MNRQAITQHLCLLFVLNCADCVGIFVYIFLEMKNALFVYRLSMKNNCVDKHVFHASVSHFRPTEIAQLFRDLGELFYCFAF